MCKHDVNHLIPTHGGIVCRKCGKVFPSLTTLRADIAADLAGEAPAKAEVKATEKPKRTRKTKSAEKE